MSDKPLPTREEIEQAEHICDLEGAPSWMPIRLRNQQLLTALSQLAEKDATIERLKASLDAGIKEAKGYTEDHRWMCHYRIAAASILHAMGVAEDES